MNSVDSSYMQQPDPPCIVLAAKNFDYQPPESAPTFYLSTISRNYMQEKKVWTPLFRGKYYFELIITITSKMWNCDYVRHRSKVHKAKVNRTQWNREHTRTGQQTCWQRSDGNWDYVHTQTHWWQWSEEETGGEWGTPETN